MSSEKVGLKVNIEKQKMVFNKAALDKEVKTDGKELTAMKKVKFVGKIKQNNRDTMPEIVNWIRSGCFASGKMSDIMKNNTLKICLKAKVFNQCVLLAITYKSETWDQD